MAFLRRGTCAVTRHDVVTLVPAQLGVRDSSPTEAPPAPATPSPCFSGAGVRSVHGSVTEGSGFSCTLPWSSKLAAWRPEPDTSSRLSSQVRFSSFPHTSHQPPPAWLPAVDFCLQHQRGAPAEILKPAPTDA